MSKKQRKSQQGEKQVSPTMSQLISTLNEVENMKAVRSQCADDESLSAVTKERHLADMDQAILMTEHMALGLMQQEIQSSEEPEQDDGEESGGYFQWTDPATVEDAWKQIQSLVPEVENMKAKITAVELDPSLTLEVKVEKISYMRACVEFVQLRIVELSERYLQETKYAA